MVERKDLSDEVSHEPIRVLIRFLRRTPVEDQLEVN